MSFILNALRKSAQQRKNGEVEASIVNSIFVIEETKAPRSTLPTWVLLFLLLNAVLLSYLLLHAHGSSDKIIAPPSPAISLLADDPSLAKENTATAHALHIENSNFPSVSAIDSKVGVALALPKTRPDITPAKLKEKKVDADQAKDKKQVNVAEQKVKREEWVMRVPTDESEQGAAVISNESPKLADVAQPIDQKTKVREYKEPITDPNNLIPLWSQLPDDLRAQVPKLNINVFAYADSAKDRFLIINMAKYKIGDAVTTGVVLQNILPESAVFVFNNQRFRLARP